MKEESHYTTALELTWKKILAMDSLEVAKNANVNFDATKNEFVVPYINKFYYVKLISKEVITSDNKPADILLSLLILKYLTSAKPIPLNNKLISFRELHGGDIYYGVFERSVLKPIIKNFAILPEKLVKTAILFGGRKLNYGDASVEIQVFPRLPVTIIVWKGDEEIPNSANVVFDETAKYHLSGEEICVLSIIVVSKLVKALNTLYLQMC